MKKAFAILSISIFAFLLNSCNEIHSAHIQGVYELDKEAFKAGIRANIEITLELLKTEQSELSEDAKAMMIDKKNSTN